jgi:hypothetical protein
MRKRELDHVLRAAGRITGSTRFIIVGSQALHAAHPDLADDIIKSVEVDLWAANAPERSEWLNAISYGSQFHETFGYYADPVDENTATLPKGWRSRLIELPPGDTEGVVAQCLDPHDLVIAKYVAARDKDRVFTSELVRRGIVSEERLLSLLQVTALDAAQRERIGAQIARDFHAGETHETVRDAASGTGPSGESTDLEAIKARARVNWLRMRNKERGRSTPEQDNGLTPDPDDDA